MSEYQPDIVSPPGETIRDLLKHHRMSRREFAEAMHYSEPSIYRLLNGQMRISPALALRLEKVFGVPASFWLNREAAYSRYLGRKYSSPDAGRAFADALTAGRGK